MDKKKINYNKIKVLAMACNPKIERLFALKRNALLANSSDEICKKKSANIKEINSWKVNLITQKITLFPFTIHAVLSRK